MICLRIYSYESVGIKILFFSRIGLILVILGDFRNSVFLVNFLLFFLKGVVYILVLWIEVLGDVFNVVFLKIDYFFDG